MYLLMLLHVLKYNICFLLKYILCYAKFMEILGPELTWYHAAYQLISSSGNRHNFAGLFYCSVGKSKTLWKFILKFRFRRPINVHNDPPNSSEDRIVTNTPGGDSLSFGTGVLISSNGLLEFGNGGTNVKQFSQTPKKSDQLFQRP